MKDEDSMGRSLRSRAWPIVVLFIVWALWTSIWWFRLSEGLDDARMFADVLLSILLLLAVLLAMWVPWSMRHGDEAERRMWEKSGFRLLFKTSTAVCLGALAAVTGWQWLYAEGIDQGSLMLCAVLLVYFGLVITPVSRLYGRAVEEG